MANVSTWLVDEEWDEFDTRQLNFETVFCEADNRAWPLGAAHCVKKITLFIVISFKKLYL